MGKSVGQGASRLAYRMLGHEHRLSRERVRYPWRRPRSDLPASRKRNRAVALRARHLRDGELLDAQRLPAGRRREDVEVGRQLRDDQRGAVQSEFWRTTLGWSDITSCDAEDSLSLTYRLDREGLGRIRADDSQLGKYIGACSVVLCIGGCCDTFDHERFVG